MQVARVIPAAAILIVVTALVGEVHLTPTAHANGKRAFSLRNFDYSRTAHLEPTGHGGQDFVKCAQVASDRLHTPARSASDTGDCLRRHRFPLCAASERRVYAPPPARGERCVPRRIHRVTTACWVAQPAPAH